MTPSRAAGWCFAGATACLGLAAILNGLWAVALINWLLVGLYALVDGLDREDREEMRR